MCLIVTSYWPFDEDGDPVEWDNNADASPNYTADGLYIDSSSDYATSAMPFPILRWSNRSGGRKVVLWDGREVPINDTFGSPTHQRGAYWSSYYKMKVVPLDILTKDIIHTTYCNWSFN